MAKKGLLTLGSLVLQGFSYQTAKEYILIRKKVDRRKARNVMRLLPFHATADKMFRDYLTTRRVLWHVRDAFPAFYGLVALRDGKKVVGPLEDAGMWDKFEHQELIRLVYQKGELWVRSCYNGLNDTVERLCAENGKIFLNGRVMSEEQLDQYLENLPVDTMILRGIHIGSELRERYQSVCPVVHIGFVQDTGTCQQSVTYLVDHSDDKGNWWLFRTSDFDRHPDIDDPLVQSAEQIARRIRNRFPELPYLDIGFVLTDEGPKIWQVDTGKELIWLRSYPKVIQEFLARQTRTVNRRTLSLKRVKRYFFSYWAKRQGFLDYMYRNWLRGLEEDEQFSGATREEKDWAHARGFYSYRIKQYGLTEENHRDILSDYDYKRLRPINGKYQKWLWDKEFMYFIMAPYSQYLPQYYYRIIPCAQGNKVFLFHDSQGRTASMEQVIHLLKEKRLLAVKSAVGSHGTGFYKLQWLGEDCAAINGEEMSEAQLLDWFNSLELNCFVSEYVFMHEQLQMLYPSVTGTIRIMTIDIGSRPKAWNAYFRIGSVLSGETDNLGHGALVAYVDMETGRYGRAEILQDHTYGSCPIHPDTGIKIEGVLPNWDLTKRKVEEIAAYLYPNEYLGFDVVITADGFRILEINTHQDLHRYPEYPQEVQDYLMRKRAQKERKYGRRRA